MQAYELSTLTGTQVLLLVVSETGLVYTFTTPKLQPLVTKPEGKNLIQACLNAPDTPTGQESPTTTRTSQNASVYGNDNPAPVDSSNNDVYDNDRKNQYIGLTAPYNQYGTIPSSMALGTSGIPPSYMSGYQYNQSHLNQYAQNSYMQPTGYWPPSNATSNGNKVSQYQNQSPEKK
ncbi:13842_t:CDS:2 [Acaulospora colombiana]|uniref:13842_t:CDS:1 n=1 Tax=Acaulospora colombiana TaxID=27376 RepID=A0ACA9KWN0_9GLOM|nr:13842_t:CDS:2 [Acaulospora colombiana]